MDAVLEGDETGTIAHRDDIQGLRGVAVALVVLGHAHLGFSGGFIGVDVFFVLSGFLITSLLLKEASARNRIDFRRFYARRSARLIPASTVTILVVVVASVEILNFIRAREVLTDGLWATGFAANIHFGRVGTNYFATQSVSPLQHFWSLAVEEQFYLLWPPTVGGVLYLRKRLLPHWRQLLRSRPRSDATDGPRAAHRTIGYLAVIAIGVSFWDAFRNSSGGSVGTYFSTAARSWELLAGALLAACQWAAPLVRLKLKAAVGWSGLVAIATSAILYDSSTKFPGTATILPVVGTCAVLVAGFGNPRFGASRLLSRRELRFIGDISYSLYLWHWPILILGKELAGRPLSTMQNILLVGASLAVAAVSNLLLENPFRRSRRLRAFPKLAFVLWPSAIVCVVVVAVLAYPVTPSPAVLLQAPPRTSDESAATLVKRAVLESDTGASIPSELQATLATASEDRSNIGTCSAYHAEVSRLCEFGDPRGTSTWTLIGNSHSAMWIPTIGEIAKRRHLRFIPLVKEACGYDEYFGYRSRGTCAKWYKWMRTQVQAMHPDTIFIGIYAYREWGQALRGILGDLAGIAKRVVVIGDAPGQPVAPVDCLLGGGATLKTCVSKASVTKIAALRTGAAIARSSGADFVDVESWFCYRSRCPSVVGSMITYVDRGHVTRTYAKFLATDLAKELDRLAPRT